MKKRFNTTGVCIPEKHYMVDVSAKLCAIMALVDEGSYFVINRPRQYGKTTILSLLEQELQQRSEYLPIFISFEGFSIEAYQDERHFLEAFFAQIHAVFSFAEHDDTLKLIEQDGQSVNSFTRLTGWMTRFMKHLQQRVVLMIDEVDKSSNHQLFLDFLALLRTKYLWTARGKDVTFHSVILAGVHDVKSLKLKLRPDDERTYNSPWNIAVDFTVDLSFSPEEIQTMLAQYVKETGVQMPQTEIAEILYYYTSGYPFLVSKLCQIIDEEIMKPTPASLRQDQDRPSQEGKVWRREHVEEAVNRLLAQSNTNFEHLIKSLENNQDLYAVVEKIVLWGEQVSYNQYSPMIHQGVMYGILTRNQNVVDIHNRLYREQIYNYMTTNLEVRELLQTRFSPYNVQTQFFLPDDALDVEHVLLKFQEFMKQEYSQRDTAFLERNGRLIFLAFLKPIINGRGYEFKEPQISEEKQLDVVVTYGRHKYLIELKIWRGEAAHQKGLRQLHDYLDRSNLEQGYLIIFDFTQKGQKTWKQERIQVEQKAIFAVWV